MVLANGPASACDRSITVTSSSAIMGRSLAGQGGADVPREREQPRADVLLQAVRLQLEAGAAAAEDHRLGGVGGEERHRDPVHLAPPLAERDAEPVLLVVHHR